MFRHAVLINFKSDADAEYRTKVAHSVGNLPNAIPEVRAATCGADAGVTPGASDFAIIVDLDSAEDYAKYAVHEAHLELVDLIRKGVDNRAVVDFQY